MCVDNDLLDTRIKSNKLIVRIVNLSFFDNEIENWACFCVRQT